MDLSEIKKEERITADWYRLSTDVLGTIIFLEYFKNKPLNEMQIKQIHEVIAEDHVIACVIRVNNGNLIPYEDEIWVEKLDLALLSDAGVLLVAYISPNNLFSRLEIEKEGRANSNKMIRIRISKDAEEAIAWLRLNHIIIQKK